MDPHYLVTRKRKQARHYCRFNKIGQNHFSVVHIHYSIQALYGGQKLESKYDCMKQRADDIIIIAGWQ